MTSYEGLEADWQDVRGRRPESIWVCWNYPYCIFEGRILRADETQVTFKITKLEWASGKGWPLEPDWSSWQPVEKRWSDVHRSISKAREEMKRLLDQQRRAAFRNLTFAEDAVKAFEKFLLDLETEPYQNQPGQRL